MKRSTKTFLLLFNLLIKIVCVAQSKDTICLPIEDVKKIYTAAEQKKVLQERVILLQSDLDILNKRIAEKDFIIADHRIISTSKDNIIQTMKEQRSLLELDIAGYKNQIKSLKRRSRWIAISGAIATSIAFYFGTKL